MKDSKKVKNQTKAIEAQQAKKYPPLDEKQFFEESLKFFRNIALNFQKVES